MKTAEEVTSDKLRGGFYTPDALVQHCLDRVAALNGQHSSRVLEPTAGDGAFLRGLANHAMSSRVNSFVGVELIESEAAKCSQSANRVPFPARVCSGSFLEWTLENEETFDVAVGNPPFVRYQFIGEGEAERIERLAARLRISLKGVSNLWVPILLGSLSVLRPGGTMAFVVPAELFTGVSAGVARAWLLRNFGELRVDLFATSSFPDVLQEVVVISGRRSLQPRSTSDFRTTIDFVQHGPTGENFWRHTATVSSHNWTQYLLSENQLRKVEEARTIQGMSKLGEVAKIEVSTVTGANAFFSLSSAEAKEWRLSEWTLPLLSRVRHAKGIEYSEADHEESSRSDTKAWFLYFDRRLREPVDDLFAKAYLQKGERKGLHRRYKTSIRTPWYRVPLVAPGKLMLSKRCHTFPRLMLNTVGAVTTDTVYQGDMLPLFAHRVRDLVAGFHNSVTLIDAELEGRSFGGGVLELVPSEIARLSVPLVEGFGAHFDELDRLYRSYTAGQGAESELIDETNERLSRAVPGLSDQLLEDLEQSRRLLQGRRLSRNR